jgi:hypothetical protein
MDPDTIMLGKYSLPVILSLILGLIYKRTKVADDMKPYISIGCGILLGVASMFYMEVSPITFPVVSDFVLAGAMAGFAATGIYETTKPSAKSRYLPVDQNGKKIPDARVMKVDIRKIIG